MYMPQIHYSVAAPMSNYHMPSVAMQPSQQHYCNTSFSAAQSNYSTITHSLTDFTPTQFLENPIFSPQHFITKPTRFIGKADEIKEFITEAFEKTTNHALQSNIEITICNKEEVKKAHERFNGIWSDGIQGFCINRHGKGISHIFVKQDELAHIMLTIGHEIGHAQSPPLRDIVEEEAKAFAFSMAFMNTIREHNIAGLGSALVEHLPAKNGIHNVGFNLVADKVRCGMSPIEVFMDFVQKGLNTTNTEGLYGLL